MESVRQISDVQDYTKNIPQKSLKPDSMFQDVDGSMRFTDLYLKRLDNEDFLRRTAAGKGIIKGMFIDSATSLLGVGSYPHEKGHTIAMSLLFKDVDPQIVLLGRERLIELLKSPDGERLGAYLETLNGANAYASFGGRAETPTDPGSRFSPDQRMAIVSSAGPLTVKQVDSELSTRCS